MKQYIAKNQIQPNAFASMSTEMQQQVSESLSLLTPRQILEWCRERGLTPQKVMNAQFVNASSSNLSNKDASKQQEYCWFCGVLGAHGSRLEQCRGGALAVSNEGVSSLTSKYFEPF